MHTDIATTILNKAKAISAELLELNLKNKLEKNGQINNIKREETGRNRKTGRRKHQKKWNIIDDTERNRKKHEET